MNSEVLPVTTETSFREEDDSWAPSLGNSQRRSVSHLSKGFQYTTVWLWYLGRRCSDLATSANRLIDCLLLGSIAIRETGSLPIARVAGDSKGFMVFLFLPHPVISAALLRDHRVSVGAGRARSVRDG